MVTLYVAEWQESERGWGTRFDGFLVTLRYERHEEMLNRMREHYYKLYGGLVPNEYTMPIEKPREVQVQRLPYHEIRGLNEYGAMWSYDKDRWRA